MPGRKRGGGGNGGGSGYGSFSSADREHREIRGNRETAGEVGDISELLGEVGLGSSSAPGGNDNFTSNNKDKTVSTSSTGISGHLSELEKGGVEPSRKRWAILTLSSLTLLATYYCYDNPSAMHDQLRDHFAGAKKVGAHDKASMDKKEFEYIFELMYSLYSFPNMIIPLLGGQLIDRLGASRTSLALSATVFLGQVLVAFGCSLRWPSLLLVGRLLFGIGGESLSVAQSVLLSQWFQGSEMAFALGINISCGRLGSVINNIMSPHIAAVVGSVDAAFWAGAIVCAVSLACCFMLYLADTAKGISEGHGSINFKTENKTETASARSSCASVVRRLPWLFWLLLLSCVFFYSSVLPFNNVASAFIIQRFICKGRCCPKASVAKHLEKGAHVLNQCRRQIRAEATASYLMSIPYIVSGALTPVFGGVVDMFGMRTVFLLVASLGLCTAHILLGFFSGIWPVVPLSLLGCCFAIYASAVWPSIPLVVSPDVIGLSFGLVTAAQNTALATVPLIVAYALNTGGWHATSFIFISLSGVAVLVAVNLLFLDNVGTGSKLSLSSREIIEWQNNAEQKKLTRARDRTAASATASTMEEHEFYKEISGNSPTRARTFEGDFMDHEDTPLLA